MTVVRPLRVLVLAEAENVHHRRFVAALRDRGHHVEVRRPGSDAGAPDVVLAGPLPHVAEIALATCDAPVVAVSWGSDLLRDVPADPTCAARVAAVLARADAVIVDSRAGERAALALGADPGALHRFPWGIDLSVHPVRPLPEGPLRIVSLRSLLPEYAVDTLVRALALAPGILADIAGDGPELPSLRALADGLGLAGRVRLVGRVAEAVVPRLLAGAHVHVSTAPTDGTSISLLQALATGRPSIVAENAANRELIESGVTGWLVPAHDPSALAERLVAVSDEMAALGPMVAAARSVAVARADWERNRRMLWRAVETAAGTPSSESEGWS